MSSEPSFYAFGPFRLDPTDRLLWRDAQVVTLTPKAIELLLLFADSGGRVLAKDDLMKRLWPDTFVEEANLSHHVYKIRDALGEPPDGGTYIETLARRGYRFVAPVTRVPRIEASSSVAAAPATDPAPAAARLLPAPRAAWRPWAAGLATLAIIAVVIGYLTRSRAQEPPVGPATVQTLAVLPFIALDPAAKDDALSVGMATAVITRLTRVEGIVTRPPSAVMKYREAGRSIISAGREQDVDAVLDGQIQRSGDRVRVTVQLVRSSDGGPLWADTFDEKLQDVLTIQDAIAEHVVSALRVTLTREGWQRLAIHDTDNMDAYRAFLNGSYHLTTFAPGGFEKSIQYLKEAVRLEPKYARAHAGLSFAYAELAGIDPHPAELVRLAKAHAEIVRTLDDTMPELYHALVNIRQYHDWDWAGTEAAANRLIELAPRDATSYQMRGWALSLLGRFEPARADLRRAQQLDPRSSPIAGALIANLTWSKRLDEARAEAMKLIAADPGTPFGHINLAQIDLLQGRTQEAVTGIENAVAPPLIQLGVLANAYGVAGHRSDAERQIATLKSMATADASPAYQIALGYAGLGDSTQALDWLERAHRERSLWMAWLKVEPAFDALRMNPRFIALEKKMNFPGV